MLTEAPNSIFNNSMHWWGKGDDRGKETVKQYSHKIGKNVVFRWVMLTILWHSTSVVYPQCRLALSRKQRILFFSFSCEIHQWDAPSLGVTTLWEHIWPPATSTLLIFKKERNSFPFKKKISIVLNYCYYYYYFYKCPLIISSHYLPISPRTIHTPDSQNPNSTHLCESSRKPDVLHTSRSLILVEWRLTNFVLFCFFGFFFLL